MYVFFTFIIIYLKKKRKIEYTYILIYYKFYKLLFHNKYMKIKYMKFFTLILNKKYIMNFENEMALNSSHSSIITLCV